jgi:carbonic anhydrase
MNNKETMYLIIMIVILITIYIFYSANFTQNYLQVPKGIILNNQCNDNSQVNLHTANAIVLSCMDFRLRDNITCTLNALSYNNNYDEFILAGTSLGYNGMEGKYKEWEKTADDHIKLAFDLHNIDTIILIDHMFCGAYKFIYNLTKEELGTEKEYKLHKENLNKSAEIIKLKYNGANNNFFKIPNLKIIKYIISIDGSKIVDIDQYHGPSPF